MNYINGNKSWYLKYTDEITEGVFLQILEKLYSLGMKSFIHCGYKINYEQFKRGGYLRTETPDIKGYDKKFCIDNNEQCIKNEIFLKNILKLEFYEIY